MEELPQYRPPQRLENYALTSAESELSAPVNVVPLSRAAAAAAAASSKNNNNDYDQDDLPNTSIGGAAAAISAALMAASMPPTRRLSSNWLRPGTSSYQAYLSFLTLGIIYGDIGTSPLYTFSTIFSNPPVEDDVVGALSAMLWSLILVVVLKYMCCILFADDHGEGGTFAIYALLSRGLRATSMSPSRFHIVNGIMATVALVSVAAVLADGVLTPAISVLGAVQGLTIASPSLQSAVVPVTCVILIILFAFQRFGTSHVSFLFSPIMVLWFFAIGSIGIYNIAQCPSVLRAFSPSYALMFFVNHGYDGWASLGAIFLTVTGCEALFADLGHFNAAAVRTGALCIVLPSLFLCYSGQAAALVVNPNIIENTFFLSIPTPLFYPMLVLATAAAVIASQAMISATFSLSQQAMRLHCFPRLTVIHTDKYEIGQVFVPEINYFYMVLVVIVVAGYQNATALGYAYGVAVSTVTLITTFFFTFVLVVNFKKHWILSVIFLCIFGAIDATFLSANLLKFTTGGWFTVTIAVIYSFIMIIWRWGRLRMVSQQAKLSVPDSDLGKLLGKDPSAPAAATATGNESVNYTDEEDVNIVVENAEDNTNTQTVIAVAPSSVILWYSVVPDAVPASFVHFIRRLPVCPQHLVFVTVAAVNVPFITSDISIVRLSSVDPQTGIIVHRVTANYGYAEPVPDAKKLAATVIREIKCQPRINLSLDVKRANDADLLAAVDPSFVIGRDKAVPHPGSNIVHRVLVSLFQALLQISRSAASALNIPIDTTLEIGFYVPI